LKAGAAAGLLALAFAVFGSVAPSSMAADAEAGRAKAEPCAGCHGEDGTSRLEAVPSLAGQPSSYLTLQLALFRDKQRVVEAMMPFVEKLSDEDVEDLAAFFSGQRLDPERGAADPAKLAEGKRLAEANHCGQCHLPDFSGREQMPRLAGQREDYLAKALADYKAGSRPGLDGTMTEVVYPLTDGDIAALAHYLAQLR
jgi:cytochrome c553